MWKFSVISDFDKARAELKFPHMIDLPPIALSVRQPWAWAIVAGHKPIETRSAGSIRAGRMTVGPICIHAAKGLTRKEFDWGYWRLDKHGVQCPRPEDLPRSAIIGVVDVVEIIDQSDSEWFGGQMGLVLENAIAIDPIPAPGALGYFEWEAGGDLAPNVPWMQKFDPQKQEQQASLFDGLPLGFKETPRRPGR